MPIQVQPRDSKERPLCVSCRGELGSTDAALACEVCAFPLHWECWRGLKRCPTSGCAGKAKHSERLTAQLAEWGPAAPLVTPDEADAPREPRPVDYGRQELAPEPEKAAPSPPAPSPPAPEPPVTSSAHPAFVDPDARKAPKPKQLAMAGLAVGVVAGLVVGFIAAALTIPGSWVKFGDLYFGVFAAFGAGVGGLLGFGVGPLFAEHRDDPEA